MSAFTFDLKQVPDVLKAGLAAVRVDHAARFGAGPEAVALTFVEDAAAGADRLSAALSKEGVTVRFGGKSAAFRALGRLLGAETRADLSFEESSAFTMRGLMADCSRNGVLRREAAEAFMRRTALMGVNMLMFYTEDTYEVPGEPFFGYLRGGFTMAEMKALDDYADALGIELIPCIQALAHLEQTLQWDPMFKYRDTNHIILAGDEDCYALIRRFIKAASSCVRSKRIHLGMDEAHGLGSGRFKEKFGDKPPFEIINEHLARVRDICREEGLKPMIWSDMYFRLGSKTHGYYDMEWQIPKETVANIPKDVQLVYWDYYHADVETYRKMIAFHRQLGSEPIMGGGIWTWSHLWCALPWSFTAVNACMSACRTEGLKEVFMTMWGDDGMEVDLFSSLPGIQFFCEQAFGAADAMEAAQKHFAGICGCPFEPWVRASGNDSVPLIEEPEMSKTAIGRALLWQDPALAILDPVLGKANLRPWYGKLAADLAAASKAGGLARRLEFPAALAAVLELKVHLRRDLSKAVKKGDRAAVKEIARGDLPELRKRVEALWKRHRAMWMETYKPFGWEVIESRYGTVMARLATLQERVDAYVAGKLDELPELTAELHNPWEGQKLGDLHFGSSRMRTPSTIK
jgi:hexosaminidase